MLCGFFFGVLLFAILSQFDSAAMASDGTLTGLKKITILVEDLDNDSRQCGVEESGIKSAFMYPISQSRIEFIKPEPVNSEKVAIFYVQIGTLRLSRTNGCVSSLLTEVLTFQRVNLEVTQRSVTTRVVLLHQSSLFTGPRDSHGKAIREAIEDHAKQFITQWNLDNRPTTR